MENTAAAKVGAMLALGGTALAFTLLPLVATRRCSRGTQPLLRFGGGVLLATTFLHLLPELREGLENSNLGDLPEILPELLMCLGFFLMYFVEELGHMMLGTDHHDPNSEKRRLCEDHEFNTLWTEGTPLRAVMITLAISVHQVFEGLAVGLEGHSNQVWILTGAIAAHKAVIALCIGAELSSAPFWGATTLISIFTLATPVGIAMGIILSGGTAMGLTAFILQGMAAGTLLFVIFFEVLRPEGNGSIKNYMATLVGFIAMLTLLYFFES
ncbi:zinc transporter ZIP1 [Halyomorpha halys]|uniref:zinc transporter ZIP1 n=1 Tax=Halyomorpha halys TaxID=286706 RepID=UPI0006D4EAFA|nr:zinc transporter ZIP1-like [Halyomorpha halys]